VRPLDKLTASFVRVSTVMAAARPAAATVEQFWNRIAT
jgi:hypothetical protein